MVDAGRVFLRAPSLMADLWSMPWSMPVVDALVDEMEIYRQADNNFPKLAACSLQPAACSPAACSLQPAAADAPAAALAAAALAL